MLLGAFDALPGTVARSQLLGDSVAIHLDLVAGGITVGADPIPPSIWNACILLRRGTMTATIGRMGEGGQESFGPGDVFAMPSSASWSLSWRQPVLAEALLVSRSSLQRDGIDIDQVRIDVPPAIAAMTFTLAAMAVQIAPDGAAHSAANAIDHLIRSAVVSMLETARPSTTLTTRSLWARSSAIVKARAGEPDFGVSELARELSISPRHLQRLMSTRGTTASAIIRRHRIHIATQGMQSSEADAPSKTELAALAGFNSVRAMRRAFEAEGVQRSTLDPSMATLRQNTTGMRPNDC